MRREDDDRIFAVENVPTLYPRACLQSYSLVFIIGRPADAVDVALFLVPVAALLLTPTAQPALQPSRLLLRQIHASTVEPQTTRVARDVESEIEKSRVFVLVERLRGCVYTRASKHLQPCF